MPKKRNILAERDAREVRLTDAKAAYRRGEFRSLQASAKAHDVNPKTLRNRWSGKHKPHVIAHVQQCCFSEAGERAVVQYCLPMLVFLVAYNQSELSPPKLQPRKVIQSLWVRNGSGDSSIVTRNSRWCMLSLLPSRGLSQATAAAKGCSRTEG